MQQLYVATRDEYDKEKAKRIVYCTISTTTHVEIRLGSVYPGAAADAVYIIRSVTIFVPHRVLQ